MEDHSMHMGHTMSGDSSGMMMMDHSSMMHMTFYFGQKVQILFDDWMTEKGWKYGISLMGIFFWCILHEYLTTTRGKIEAAIKASYKGKDSYGSTGFGMNASALHFVATFLYLVNVTSSYFLMLIVMTYNAGIFIMLVLGLACGYLLFRRPGTHYYSSEACCA